MISLKDVTVIIVTFQTPKKVIFECLKSINSRDVNILIIENSQNFLHKDYIKTNFSNVTIICTGENLGYGKGNNFGIKNTKSDYALILNPDVICDKNFFLNIPSVIEQAGDFSVIGCQYLLDKSFMPAGFFDKKKNIEFNKNFKNDQIGDLAQVEWVTGCSMLLNLKKFYNKDVFDKNFFLYFEEFDLCKSLIKKQEKILTAKKLKINHLGFKSSTTENQIDNKKLIYLKDWHYMWSSFYFYKKNFGYIFALNRLIGKLLKSLIKTIFYSITFQEKRKNKYLYRFLGLFNSIVGRPSNFRG
tara:strand:+ start:19 stop:921 length:903 start_codon:yes stop_codon:yes gene_type:complete